MNMIRWSREDKNAVDEYFFDDLPVFFLFVGWVMVTLFAVVLIAAGYADQFVSGSMVFGGQVEPAVVLPRPVDVAVNDLMSP